MNWHAHWNAFQRNPIPDFRFGSEAADNFSADLEPIGSDHVSFVIIGITE